jgi:16S rRNA (guanine966-N2)-methyltransferase
MRIVAGRWAGRDLTSPADARVRPTAEAVRGALLDLLAPVLPRARVLDLFAGTGALGLEALSRGAASADFVESRPASLHALRANVAALHARERTRIFKRDAIPFAAALEPDRYDLAFADPPYGSRMADRIVESWLARPFARVLAVEHAAEQVLPGAAAGGRGEPGDRRPARMSTHRVGDTAVTIYRSGEGGPPLAVPREQASLERATGAGKRPHGDWGSARGRPGGEKPAATGKSAHGGKLGRGRKPPGTDKPGSGEPSAGGAPRGGARARGPDGAGRRRPRPAGRRGRGPATDE